MTIVGLYPFEDAYEPPAKVGFYIPTDPAHPNDNLIKYYIVPFENGEPETLLSFIQ